MYTRTYRPISYSLEAMGESSECIERMPSKGRSGVGLTIVASMLASTLRRMYKLDAERQVQQCVPRFAHRAFDAAKLCAKRERRTTHFEWQTSIEPERLLERFKKKLFLGN